MYKGHLGNVVTIPHYLMLPRASNYSSSLYVPLVDHSLATTQPWNFHYIRSFALSDKYGTKVPSFAHGE